MAGVHDTIGRDLVNHCVNDILVQGATPLFFLDYLATGRLSPDVAEQIVTGLAAACRDNGCALLGGETAEMPGFYADGEYDVAGFIVGAVERSRLVDGRGLVPGDVLIGLPSTGLHTNGYSLARRIVFDRLGLTVDSRVPELGETVGAALLRTAPLVPRRDAAAAPGRAGQGHGAHHRRRHHRQPAADPAARHGRGSAASRRGSCPRCSRGWRRAGGVPLDDQYRAFNMGLGLVVAVSATDAARASPRCWATRASRRSSSAGSSPGRPASCMSDAPAGRRIGVLVSGRGSNLQALIDAVGDGRLDATIAVVISNVAGVPALARAEQAGIETLVISHAGWPSREAFDARLATALLERGVQLVCLAGFMRRLSARLSRALPRAGIERSPVAAAGVPRDRGCGPGAGARREGGRLHRPPGDARTRRRADRAPGGGAGAGRRHRRVARRAHPGRGAPAVSGRGGPRARRRLAPRRTAVRRAALVSGARRRAERQPDAQRPGVGGRADRRGREAAATRSRADRWRRSRPAIQAARRRWPGADRRNVSLCAAAAMRDLDSGRPGLEAHRDSVWWRRSRAISSRVERLPPVQTPVASG